MLWLKAKHLLCVLQAWTLCLIFDVAGRYAKLWIVSAMGESHPHLYFIVSAMGESHFHCYFAVSPMGESMFHCCGEVSAAGESRFHCCFAVSAVDGGTVAVESAEAFSEMGMTA